MPSSTPLPLPRLPRTTDARGRSAVAVLAAGLLVAVGVASWLWLRPGPLPVLGSVPTFALTERSGEQLGASDLGGRVWVADFIFTRCPDFCPALTARIAASSSSGGASLSR